MWPRNPSGFMGMDNRFGQWSPLTSVTDSSRQRVDVCSRI